MLPVLAALCAFVVSRFYPCWADACCGSVGCRPWKPSTEATTSHGLTRHGRRRSRLHRDRRAKGDDGEVRNPRSLTLHTEGGPEEPWIDVPLLYYEYAGMTGTAEREAVPDPRYCSQA